MKIYLKKLTNHDLTHQFSIPNYIDNDFFGHVEAFRCTEQTTGETGTVRVLRARDPRLGGDFDTLLRRAGEVSAGDIVIFLPNHNEFSLKVIKHEDLYYEAYRIFFSNIGRDDHAIVDAEDPLREKTGCNKIFYGVPGCGKSTYIKRTVLNGVPDDGKHIFRTTFHPEYSNSDFVGQIMPKIEKDDAGEDVVTYSFAPGPFALALKEAYEHDEMIYLVIEEINRGNASAIFGDIFQLLDRVKDSDNPKYGESEFPITNVALQDYLSKELHREIKEIKIPSNLTILATMNTSDQNVFAMDTAFKRRWSFEQIGNEFGDDHPYKNWYVPGTNVTWETFLNKTNEAILGFKIANSSNEDKRMGKYFVTKDCLTENENDGSPEAAKNFAYKVLEYLWNDVCKFNREEMFDTANNKTLEELIKHFAGDEHLSIFVNPNFRDQN